VTRYVSLYTSISTEYDFDFDDPGALVQPFSVTGKDTLFAGQSPTVVNYRRDRGVKLSGYQVASNSLGMVHSEHMTEMGGAISIRQQGGRMTLVNASRMTIREAAIVAPDGVARLGTVEPGASVTFVPTPKPAAVPAPKRGAAARPSKTASDTADDTTAAPQTSTATATPSDTPSDTQNDTQNHAPPDIVAKGTLNIDGLLRYAEENCPPEETRLIGWTDEKVPGMSMVPTASQQRQANLIIVHLEHAPMAGAAPDANPRPREKDMYIKLDGEPAQ
jgi:hypothetical protein